MDIKLIREDPELVRRNLERRHDPGKLARLDALIEDDARWREMVTEVNRLRRRNSAPASVSGTLNCKQKWSGVVNLITNI